MSLGFSVLVMKDGTYLARGRSLATSEIRILAAGFVLSGAAVIAIVIDGIIKHGRVAAPFLGALVVVGVAEGATALVFWMKR